MFDIVMGGNTELAKMAVQLGYTSLIIVYHSLDEVYKAQLPPNNGLKMSYAVMLDTTDKNKIISVAKEAAQENILCLVKAKQPEFNRFIVEKTSASLVDAEHVHPKDHLHFRRSGLDQVLCKAAKKPFFSSLSSFFSLRFEEQAKVLGRIKQNARFCAKYNVPYALCSFAREPFEMKGAHDMKMLWKLLGIKSDIF
ncbi:MAG TPA: hypothetical protein VJK72_00835 [Candidatus Nanoarchaeia archaeon]|nr:hypothetical protein [Candidatus Nanoarchaeia archaeon]